ASSPKLARGKFAPAKGGALVGPGAALVSARATVLGGGRDGLSFVFQTDSSRLAPTVPFDVRVQFGPTFDVAVPASAFVRRGATFVLARPVAGIRKLTVNTATGA